MANADERLVVMLEARIRDFEKNMQKAEQRGTRTYTGLRRDSRSATRGMEADMNRSTTAINRALASTSSQIGAFGKAFAVGIGASVFAGLTTNIVQTVKGVAALGDEAERAGLGLEAFQEWKFVAEQNRIGLDAMVDGFKELSLRADEFIVTGAGPAAEAFRRIGYSGERLQEALKDPSELMVEIIDRMQGLDKAAQIRISDEIFGGTAGERFVELLDEGRAGIDATIQKAHEAGAVLEEEMVAKAAELDRRFNELQASVGSFFKKISVGAAGAVVELTDMRAQIEGLFPDEDMGRAVLGDELFDALSANRDLLNENSAEVQALDQHFRALEADASQTAQSLLEASANLRSIGQTDAADEMAQLAIEMDAVTAGFRNGEISGEDMVVKLGEIEASATDAFNALGDADRIGFGNVISRLGGLGAAIANVAAQARGLAADIAKAAGIDSGTKHGEAMRKRHEAEQQSMEVMREQAAAKEKFLKLEDQQNAKTSEQLKLEREVESIRNRAKEAGAHLTGAELEKQAADNLAALAARSGGGSAPRSSGGGSSGGGAARSESQSDWQREVEGTREKIAAWEAEAAALVAVAESGQQYGDAVEYARKRAELLNAAQQDGKEITPELRAEIDQLAQSYMTAGLEADEAADRLRKIEDASQRGKDALTDLFGSIFDGSMSAKEAVAQLLAEIAKTQFLSGIMGLPGFGGAAKFIGNLIPGFAKGGDHDGGLRFVGEKGVELEATGPARYWTASQMQSAMQGQQGGGNVEITLHAPPGFTAEQMQQVHGVAVKVVQKSAPEIISQSVGASQRSMRKSKAGWGV